MNRRYFLQSSLAGAVAACLPMGRLFADTPVVGAIEAVTGNGSPVSLEKAALQELKARLRGALLLRGEPGYDEARRVLNRSIDRYPALVVQPTGAADIRTAVDFARERELLLAVKCGGHSYSGRSTCDRGMQIDLSRFRGVRVDPVSRTAYVSGGSLLGELDHEAMAYGLVTTAGTVSHTGVAGLTLGGGFGRVARRYGLALDNLRAVELVTADGKVVPASASENPDLFWGVRGAVQADRNDAESILAATNELMRELLDRNHLAPADFVSVIFTCTDDLDAEFPAVAARELGLDQVPLLCNREMDVPGSMERVIRLLAHYYAPEDHKPAHVYIGETRKLRADLHSAQ